MAGANNSLNWNTYPGIGTNGVPGQVGNASAFPSSTTSGWGTNVFTGATNPYKSTVNPFAATSIGTGNPFGTTNAATSAWGNNVFTGVTNPSATTGFSGTNAGMSPLLSMLGLGTPSSATTTSTNPSIGQQATNIVTGGMNSFLSMLGLAQSPSTLSPQTNTGTRYSNQLGWGNGIFNAPGVSNGPFETMTDSNTGTNYSDSLGWGNGIFNAPGVNNGPFETMTDSNTGTTYGNSLGLGSNGTNVDISSVIGGASQTPSIFATLGATAMNNYQQYNANYGVGSFLSSLFATPAPTDQQDPNADPNGDTSTGDPNTDSEQGDPNSDELAAIQSEAVIDPNNPDAISEYTSGDVPATE